MHLVLRMFSHVCPAKKDIKKIFFAVWISHFKAHNQHAITLSSPQCKEKKM